MRQIPKGDGRIDEVNKDQKLKGGKWKSRLKGLERGIMIYVTERQGKPIWLESEVADLVDHVCM